MRRTPATSKIKELEIFNADYDKDLKYDFDVTYWRKAWNIRNDILFILGKRWTDEYEFNVTKDDVDKIIELLQSYNSENFEDSGSCFWDWDDEDYPYSEYVQENIANLQILRQLMDKYDLEVYFYDSY